MDGTNGKRITVNRLDKLPISYSEFARLADDVFKAQGLLRFRAGGKSMWPFLGDGDTLIVAPLGGRSPRVGDVLVYRFGPDRVRAHRVVWFDPWRMDGLRIRGDRLRTPLERIDIRQVLGRVVAVERTGDLIHTDDWRVRGPVLGWLAVRGAFNIGRGGLRRGQRVLDWALAAWLAGWERK